MQGPFIGITKCNMPFSATGESQCGAQDGMNGVRRGEEQVGLWQIEAGKRAVSAVMQLISYHSPISSQIGSMAHKWVMNQFLVGRKTA